MSLDLITCAYVTWSQTTMLELNLWTSVPLSQGKSWSYFHPLLLWGSSDLWRCMSNMLLSRENHTDEATPWETCGCALYSTFTSSSGRQCMWGIGWKGKTGFIRGRWRKESIVEGSSVVQVLHYDRNVYELKWKKQQPWIMYISVMYYYRRYIQIINMLL